MGADAGTSALIFGSIIQGIGAKHQADAEKDAAKFNARITREQTGQEVARIRAIGRREESTNITRIAKSGVRLEGSPLGVLAENAALVEREALQVQRAGMMQAALFKARARNAETAGRIGLAGSIIGAGIGGASLFGTSGKGAGTVNA